MAVINARAEMFLNVVFQETVPNGRVDALHGIARSKAFAR